MEDGILKASQTICTTSNGHRKEGRMITREERDNAIRFIKKWHEGQLYLQTYKTCLEALEQCQTTEDIKYEEEPNLDAWADYLQETSKEYNDETPIHDCETCVREGEKDSGECYECVKGIQDWYERKPEPANEMLPCDRNICVSNEYNGIGCAGCICTTESGACQKDDLEEVMPVENIPCEERVSIGVLEQVMWERDVAISQLNDLGYGLGQKLWISVNDFLPPERENPITMDFYEYPVTFRSGDVRDVRYYKYGNGHWWHGSGIMDEYVTAWMPIPKVYEEDK